MIEYRKTFCPSCGATFRALKPGEKRIVEALEEGPLRFKELRERAALSPPALSPYLRILRAEGYLVKDGDLFTQSEEYVAGMLDHLYVIDQITGVSELQSPDPRYAGGR